MEADGLVGSAELNGRRGHVTQGIGGADVPEGYVIVDFGGEHGERALRKQNMLPVCTSFRAGTIVEARCPEHVMYVELHGTQGSDGIWDIWEGFQ